MGPSPNSVKISRNFAPLQAVESDCLTSQRRWLGCCGRMLVLGWCSGAAHASHHLVQGPANTPGHKLVLPSFMLVRATALHSHGIRSVSFLC